ncbi:hypothetical protein C6N75_15495, partial [Streptomyces solincola]
RTGRGGSSAPAPERGTAAPPRTPSPSGPPTTGGRAVEGSWVGTTDGRPVSLTVKGGRAVVLAEAHVCQGVATGPATALDLTLACDGGYTARTSGAARITGTSLTVDWAGGAKDKLTAAAPPKD